LSFDGLCEESGIVRLDGVVSDLDELGNVGFLRVRSEAHADFHLRVVQKQGCVGAR
jgi:hypothetical protein